MMHEGEKLDREITRLEQELQKPLHLERRIQIEHTLEYLRARKNIWTQKKRPAEAGRQV